MNNRKEVGAVWCLILLAGMVTTIPYLLGYLWQPEGMVFSGLMMGVEDGNSYLGKMMSGYAGNWLFRTPYSAAPQQGLLIYLPYILLGKLIHPPELHRQLIFLFQLFRIAGLLVYGWGFYYFLRLFLRRPVHRVAGVALGLLGGGLGWLFLLPGLNGWYDYLPLDFYSPETFGFLSLLIYPHNSCARGLMLLGITIGIQALFYYQGKERLRAGLAAGVCFFLAGFFQPLNAGIGVLVIGLAAIVKWVEEKSLTGSISIILLNIIPGLTWVVYVGCISGHDPFFQAWTEQNKLSSPPLLQYVIAYGVLLGIIGIHFKQLRVVMKKPIHRILVIWIILLPMLVYLPTGLQRRMPEGIWCALITLFMLVMEQLPEVSSIRWIKGSTVVSSFSPLVMIAANLFGMKMGSQQVYLPTGEIEAFRFLQQVPKGSVVLTSQTTGNNMPAWAPVRVVVGHSSETVHLDQVNRELIIFFRSETTQKERCTWIRENDIGYVFIGPQEHALGAWSPEEDPCFMQIYSHPPYAVYQVWTCNP